MDIIEVLDKINSYNEVIENNKAKLIKLEEEFYSKINPLQAQIRGLEKERQELIDNVDRYKLLNISIKSLIEEFARYLSVDENNIDIRYVPMMKIYDNYNRESKNLLITDNDLLEQLNYKIVFYVAGFVSIEFTQKFDIENKINVNLFRKHAKFKRYKNSKYLTLEYDEKYLQDLVLSLTYYDLLYTAPYGKNGSIIKDLVKNILERKKGR